MAHPVSRGKNSQSQGGCGRHVDAAGVDARSLTTYHLSTASLLRIISRRRMPSSNSVISRQRSSKSAKMGLDSANAMVQSSSHHDKASTTVLALPDRYCTEKS
jgi:hypothetical protein